MTTSFEILFGLPAKYIHQTCVLTPFLPKGFVKEIDVQETVKGKSYSTGLADAFTLIRTPAGPYGIGDAVLYLKETPCRRIIMIGACGAMPSSTKLGLGSNVLARTSFNFESFSNMLIQGQTPPDEFSCEVNIFDRSLNALDKKDITEVRCASVGSIKLENEYLEEFTELEIDAVDMECSALYSAAQKTQIPAVALMYVSDILGRHANPWIPLTNTERAEVGQGGKLLIGNLKKLVQALS